MGDLLSYLAHQGIVRVLSVPIIIAAIMYVLWILAAPPSDLDENEGNPRNS